MEPVVVEPRFKTISKWASLIKDILSSVKDGGIILFVIALILFRDPVLKYFESKGINIQSVNALGGIQMAVKSLTALAESQPIAEVSDPKAGVPESVKPADEVQQIERAALSSPESALIKDWAVIIAGYPDLKAAQTATESIDQKTTQKSSIFKKRNSFRVLVQIGSRDQVDASLKLVRSQYQGSYLVSMSAWCGDYESADGYITCKAT